MRRRFSGRPSPAMVVACVAVVLAGVGTAGAAGSFIASSSQIKDDVILSRDIHDNTLRGVDIQDGTIGVNNLTAGSRNALRGPRGGRGVQGVRGRRGIRGPRGTTALDVRTVLSSVDVAPSATSTLKSSCARGRKPIGGGGGDSGGKLVVNDTRPEGDGWSVTATNTDPAAAHRLSVRAVCAR